MSRTTVMLETGPPAAGFFGKLPSRGDFIARRLPKSFLEPWDGWLQAAIAYSRNQLAEAWVDSYCTSPLWRFALSAGLCGPASYAGVLMPSVDRVNRYYPLVIASALATHEPLLTLPVAGADWFGQVEQLALEGLDNDALDLEDFTQRVEALGAPSLSGVSECSAMTGKAWHCSLPESLNLLEGMPALASYLLQRTFTRPSLWWTEGSERVARCLLMCEGLPPIEGFSALLAGDWSQWGWNELPLAGVVTLDKPSAAEEASL